MHVRRIRLLLAAASVALGALSVLAVTAAVLLPYRGGEPLARKAGPGGAADHRDLQLPPLAAFETSARMDLRRPLFDAPPPAAQAAPAPPPPPPLTIRLAGTIMEPGHSRAILLLPDGTTELKRVGEVSGNVQILEITQDSITVLFHDSTVSLHLEKPEKANGS